MKKTITIICLILSFFVIYFLQANFFTWFNIAGIMPNLYVILVLFIGLFMKRKLRISIWNKLRALYRYYSWKNSWNIGVGTWNSRNIGRDNEQKLLKGQQIYCHFNGYNYNRFVWGVGIYFNHVKNRKHNRNNTFY